MGLLITKPRVSSPMLKLYSPAAHFHTLTKRADTTGDAFESMRQNLVLTKLLTKSGSAESREILSEAYMRKQFARTGSYPRMTMGWTALAEDSSGSSQNHELGPRLTILARLLGANCCKSELWHNDGRYVRTHGERYVREAVQSQSGSVGLAGLVSASKRSP